MPKIIIFDSGVGGFSILKELVAYSLDFVYLADQAGFPYGDKSKEWMEDRLAKISAWIREQNPDLVIMACNTATVVGVELVRSNLTCPVVGVEPVVSPASRYKKSLILGTATTLASARLKTLLAGSGGNISVYTPKHLPQAIEDINITQVKKIINTVKNAVEVEKFEAIGLSCTHYPLVKDIFSELIPQVEIIDPSPAVARQVLKVLDYQQTTQFGIPAKPIFYTSGPVLRLNEQIKHYLQIESDAIEVVL